MKTKDEIDPLIHKPYLDELAAAYLHGADVRDPLVSPICGDLHGLPPLLIYVGAAETLLDDSVRISAVAGAAGVRVTLDIWPDMIHAFSLFYPQLAVARQALAQVGGFVQAMTGGDGTIAGGLSTRQHPPGARRAALRTEGVPSRPGTSA
jgi:epsilon-lactone hydrolase